MNLKEQFMTYDKAQVEYMVGRSKLQALVSRGVIRKYRLGKKALLSIEDLDAALIASESKPKKKVGRPRRGAPRE